MIPQPVTILTLILILLLAGAVGWAGVVWAYARSMVRPPRMTDARAMRRLNRLSPGDLAMPFEDLRFDIRDSATGEPITLRAWWMPAGRASERCVILLHGYADAKVGAIAWAPMWRGLGFHVLALDLRAHGDSGGRYCTAGVREAEDLEVLSDLRAARPRETEKVVLFGISYGAAVAAGVATRREDVDAIVLESPYSDFRSAATRHGELMLAPGATFRAAAFRLAECLAGVRFGEMRTPRLLAAAKCPWLVIHGDADRLMPPEEIATFRDLATGPTRQHHLVAGAGHNRAMETDPVGYAARIERFLMDAGIVETNRDA
jgi:alpha-beta hydrolase superfamily lysophospholipase